MRKTIILALLVALILPLVGCQPVPQEVIQVHEAQFKYRGSLVWLYEGADGAIHMLRVAESRLNLFNKGSYLTGKGQWEEIADIKKNQLIYVREAELTTDQQKEVLQRPDYVLAVNLEKLRNKIPQIKNEAELDLLQTAFQASLESDNN